MSEIYFARNPAISVANDDGANTKCVIIFIIFMCEIRFRLPFCLILVVHLCDNIWRAEPDVYDGVMRLVEIEVETTFFLLSATFHYSRPPSGSHDCH